MPTSKRNMVIVEIISILLIILFCYAAISKLTDFKNFQVQLNKSPLLTGFVPFISWAVPIFELFVAALLVFKLTKITGLYLSLFLMMLFTTYIVIILNFSYYIPCSCGGILGSLPWRAHLIFNLFFLVIIIIGILLQPKELTFKSNAPVKPLITGEAENL